MSKNDVMQVMGTPRRTDVNQERERWIYWNKAVYGYTVVDNEQLATDRLTVTFVNGKVTKWGQQTLTDDILESSQKTAQAYAEAAKGAKNEKNILPYGACGFRIIHFWMRTGKTNDFV